MYKYNLGLAFEKVVEEHHGNTALKFSTACRISYIELNERANQIGHYLLDMGTHQMDVVGISGDKRLDTYACMLACLKIGAVYTMLDPDSPLERLNRIFSTCRPKALFVGSQLAENLADQNEATIIRNDTPEFAAKIAEFRPSSLDPVVDVVGTNPAYIMYTSGSTGIPKGAVMTHANLLNLIAWSIAAFDITSMDVFTNANPLYFDNSVFDFYSSLFSGACLVPLSKEVVSDAQSLVTAVDELECTSWFSVPSLLIFLQTMKAMNRDNMKGIKRIIFGGEGYPKSKLKKLYDTYSDRVQLFNVYGPTECTCICSSYRITEDDFEDMQGFSPLGKMIPNFSYLILDENCQKVPDNEVGELCLLGPNVGRGYYNDPDRTQLSFVQNPYNTDYTEFMYKTGDLVRYDPGDGKVYILGRKDNQIKHMGYRIELEEIETAISRLDYIAEAAVLHGNNRGFSQIIAVFSAENGKATTDTRMDLKRILPDYMIPTIFHQVEELPKNANGKTDRVSLAETYLDRNSQVV
jgi:D-alanine--poly(phosphoribitol) ligase subunit 1